jgi:hypothetical protein
MNQRAPKESSDSNTLNDIDKIIQSELTAIRSKSLRPKELLSKICFKYFHHYNEVETPAKIAENLSKDYLEKFPEITTLIQRITEYRLG